MPIELARPDWFLAEAMPTDPRMRLEWAKQRRALVYALRANGATYTDIGRLFKVCGQRARQIDSRIQSAIESRGRARLPALLQRAAKARAAREYRPSF